MIFQIFAILAYVYLKFNADENVIVDFKLNVKNIDLSLNSNLIHNNTNIQPVTKPPQLSMSTHDHNNNKTFAHSSTSATKTAQPNTSPSKCTYEKDVTIYMDAFERLIRGFFGPEYRDFLVESEKCSVLPGGGRCVFNYKNKHSDAIFYYGSLTELKFKRVFDGQIVVVFTMEAESGPYCQLPPADQYDMKISYKRNSTVPKLFLCQDNVAKQMVEMGQPDVSPHNRSLVAAFIHNCIEWRVDYIKELMNYVHVDQWGDCLKNTPGEFYKTRHGPYSKTKIDFLRKNRYKFVLSFENTVDPDYVSEKVYDAYLSHTIPIFYGDRAVFDLVPGDSTLVYANDYTPKELAELIKRVDSNDTLYHQYFNWDLSKMRKLDEEYCSEYFMCRICRKVWESLRDRKCGKN